MKSFVQIPSPSLSDSKARLSPRCPSSPVSLVPDTNPGVSQITHPLQLLTVSVRRGQNYYPHFTDEKIKAQGGTAMVPRSRSKSMQGQGSTLQTSCFPAASRSPKCNANGSVCPQPPAEASIWLPAETEGAGGVTVAPSAPGVTNTR